MLLLLRLEKFAILRWREFFWKIKKWSTIPPERLGFELKDGTQFRIALLINDSDGGIRSRTMLFFDGLDGHKDTGKFGLVQLRSGRRK